MRPAHTGEDNLLYTVYWFKCWMSRTRPIDKPRIVFNLGVQPSWHHVCPPYFSIPIAGSIFFRKTLASQISEVPPFSNFLQCILSTLYTIRPDDSSLLLFCVSWASRVLYKMVSSLKGINYHVTCFYHTLHSTWFGAGTEEAIQK